MPASAHPPPGVHIVDFTAHVVRDRKGPVCMGQPVKVRVVVRALAYWGPDVPGKAPMRVRRRVYAYVNGMGSIEPESRTGTFPAELAIGDAVFTYRSPAAGEATLQFSVDIEPFDPMVSNEATRFFKLRVEHKIKVIPCKFDITTLGDWNVPGEADISVSAWSDDIEVKADGPQAALQGSGTVNWRASLSQVEDCGGAITLGSSRLEWTGSMDDNGQLNLTGTYLPAAGSLDLVCARGGESTDGEMPLELTPDPIQLTVASSGGTFQQSQVLDGPEATPGKVTIIVVPVEDQAAAYEPDQASAAWLIRLWDTVRWTNDVWLGLDPSLH